MQSDQNSDPGDENWFSSQEYHDAITVLGSTVTPLHRRMLAAHADAPDHMLSVRQLAAAGGYKLANVTYSQYGRLGRHLAQALGVKEDWKVWTNFIGEGFRTETDELIWAMHPELVEALRMLEWATGYEHSSFVDDIEQLDEKNESFMSKTEREALIQARVGQGAFRIELVKYWGSCAVTGVSEPSVLRASHIKPWRACDNRERLDPFNGLLLAAHIDALFDKGLITFEFDGLIRLSPLLAHEDVHLLGILPTLQLRRIDKEHKEYLRHHHEIFRSGMLLKD
jgi:HNH endonuclease